MQLNKNQMLIALGLILTIKPIVEAVVLPVCEFISTMDDCPGPMHKRNDLAYKWELHVGNMDRGKIRLAQARISWELLVGHALWMEKALPDDGRKRCVDGITPGKPGASTIEELVSSWYKCLFSTPSPGVEKYIVMILNN